MNRIKLNELEPLVSQFFGRAKCLGDTARTKFGAEHKISRYKCRRILPMRKWRRFQDDWLREQLRPAFNDALSVAPFRDRFTLVSVWLRVRSVGIGRPRFDHLAREEWHKRRMTLPTRQETVLACIKDLVTSRIPLEKMTIRLINKTLGISLRRSSWLWEGFVAGRLELQKYHTSPSTAPPPEGIRALSLPGGKWVDLDEDVWDLRPQASVCFKRDSLRGDIAEIGWPQLRNALLEGRLAHGTIINYYIGYRLAGELLGSVIPDVREATLADVQRAWLQAEFKSTNLTHTRGALKTIFTHLCSPEAGLPNAKAKEILKIVSWLYTAVIVRSGSPDQYFLSSDEMQAVITACLTDVKAGLDYADTQPDLMSLSTKVRAAASAALLEHWATALMVLLMLFVGLRRQSVVNLKIGDWSEIRPGMFALMWFHGKKREAKVAILATSVALLLDQYVQRTDSVRQSLGIKEVFLTRDKTGCWQAQKAKHLPLKLVTFIKRHNVNIADIPVRLSSQILRRTYVTRELYLGRTIWALRLQLGHETLKTTRKYAKFDMYEHPAEVGSALNEYGRQSLTLWHHPRMLVDLEPSERNRLLGVKEERHQDVGLCRFDSCRKILPGNPPPCSLCEHLATGPEFAGAWEAEREAREKEIERLVSTPNADHLLAEKRYQYEMFRANFDYMKGKTGR